jgi:copper chaperone
MITFKVSDMTCGHCAGAITRAISAVDKGARLEIDTPRQLVRVSGAASAELLAQAINGAGYTALQVADAAPAAASPRSSGGCGCGIRKAAPVDVGQQGVHARDSCCG